MPTKLYLGTPDEDGGPVTVVIVREEFDAMIERVIPSRAPSSSLEHQHNQTYELLDGRRVLISPGVIFMAEEITE